MQDVLQKRLPFLSLSPGWCIMCGVSDEYRDHLFLNCSVAYSIWNRLLKEFGVNWVLAQEMSQHPTACCRNWRFRSKTKEIMELGGLSCLLGPLAGEE